MAYAEFSSNFSASVITSFSVGSDVLSGAFWHMLLFIVT